MACRRFVFRMVNTFKREFIEEERQPRALRNATVKITADLRAFGRITLESKDPLEADKNRACAVRLAALSAAAEAKYGRRS